MVTHIESDLIMQVGLQCRIKVGLHQLPCTDNNNNYSLYL